MTMILAFRLSMPGFNSWNGKWSGEGKLYAIVRSYSGRQRENLISLIEGRSFPYSFGDGWVAIVNVAQVDATEAKRIKKQSAGFCGYDWMVDSLVQHGEIRS